MYLRLNQANADHRGIAVTLLNARDAINPGIKKNHLFVSLTDNDNFSQFPIWKCVLSENELILDKNIKRY
jgi:hypothetical protein